MAGSWLMRCNDCYAPCELQWYQAEHGTMVVKARRIFPRKAHELISAGDVIGAAP